MAKVIFKFDGEEKRVSIGNFIKIEVKQWTKIILLVQN